MMTLSIFIFNKHRKNIHIHIFLIMWLLIISLKNHCNVNIVIQTIMICNHTLNKILLLKIFARIILNDRGMMAF